MSGLLFGIYWDQFDWQSFATITTGLSAVLGATIVGLRQLRIVERQTDIAAKQTGLISEQTRIAESALRHDLYDRRYRVYRAFRNATVMTVYDGSLPDKKAFLDFQAHVLESRFLFSSRIASDLMEVQQKIASYVRLSGDSLTDDECKAPSKYSGEMKVVHEELKRDYERISDLFYDEMKLSELQI